MFEMGTPARWTLRIALAMIGGVTAAGLLELGSRALDPHTSVGRIARYTEGYAEPDEALGYAPTGAVRQHAIGKDGAKTIFDVTYTIGPDRLRITPTPANDDPTRCALFFGDSFTFGEGVNDEEAMPYVVGRLTGYRTYNSGFVGYGPHQMLAAIERGIVVKVVKCRPRLVVYQAIPDHAWRAAGKAPWDSHGPHYEATNEGLKYLGHFDDERVSRAANRLRRYLRHSSLYRRFIETRVTTGDIRRFAEIVAAARDNLGQLYPSASFLVIMWDPGASKKLAMLEADSLTARHIETVLISDILPGYGDTSMQARFVLSANDQHPTATTHRLIAEYVAGALIH